MSAEKIEVWDRLVEFVAHLIEEKRIPGVCVGVLHEGRVTTAGFGVTNVDHPLPITDETLFQIGSITKTFTGTAILRLVGMGKLDLDARVRNYVPAFQVKDELASEEATIRHLLIHTGGWAGDFFRATGGGDDALARYVADMADLPQLAPLGTIWSYNNAGFSLAGYVIEKVTGQTYESAIKDLVFEPLGLECAFFFPGQVMTHRFAVGHRVDGGEARVARPWPLERSAYPAGGIVCHVRDLLRYAGFHLGDGTLEDRACLVPEPLMTQMQSPQVALWGSEAWGLTWAISEVGGMRQISHGGGTTGQVTLLVLVPEHDFAIAILTNADRGGMVTDKVRRWALREYLGLEEPRAEPLEAPEKDLAQYAGHYEGFLGNVDLGLLAGRLVGLVTYKRGFPNEETAPLPAPPPMTLGLCEKDRLLVLDGRFKDAKVDVIRRADGSVGWLRSSGRLHVRQDREGR